MKPFIFKDEKPVMPVDEDISNLVWQTSSILREMYPLCTHLDQGDLTDLYVVVKAERNDPTREYKLEYAAPKGCLGPSMPVKTSVRLTGDFDSDLIRLDGRLKLALRERLCEAGAHLNIYQLGNILYAEAVPVFVHDYEKKD